MMWYEIGLWAGYNFPALLFLITGLLGIWKIIIPGVSLWLDKQNLPSSSDPAPEVADVQWWLHKRDNALGPIERDTAAQMLEYLGYREPEVSAEEVQAARELRQAIKPKSTWLCDEIMKNVYHDPPAVQLRGALSSKPLRTVSQVSDHSATDTEWISRQDRTHQSAANLLLSVPARNRQIPSQLAGGYQGTPAELMGDLERVAAWVSGRNGSWRTRPLRLGTTIPLNRGGQLEVTSIGPDKWFNLSHLASGLLCRGQQ